MEERATIETIAVVLKDFQQTYPDFDVRDAKGVVDKMQDALSTVREHAANLNRTMKGGSFSAMAKSAERLGKALGSFGESARRFEGISKAMCHSALIVRDLSNCLIKEDKGGREFQA